MQHVLPRLCEHHVLLSYESDLLGMNMVLCSAPANITDRPRSLNSPQYDTERPEV